MSKWSEKNKDRLIERMFRVIADHHFRDHKMIRTYCRPVEKFPRSLGEDIANCVQAINPKLYHHIKKEY